MRLPIARLAHSPLRILAAVTLCLVAMLAFLSPGLSVARDLSDEALGAPGIPRVAWRLHRALSPRFEAWARERVASGRAATVSLHDVPTTEWPMFSAVFFLMATDQLEARWDGGDHTGAVRPMDYAAGAVAAARDLVLDPTHHTWVRTHWGEGYLHRENVFFRSLLIAALTSYQRLTHDGTALPMLRDQVDTLARDLEGSRLGVLSDYPGECYPIDVVAGLGFMRHADAVLGTDHGAFLARAVRGFVGPMADPLGLVPYRVDVSTGRQEQPSRGIGNSWVSVYATDLWPDIARDWYMRYERSFWQDHGWAAGFREYPRGSPEGEWFTEVDAGPVLDGLGTSASAFGIAAARRNGRLDEAYTLSAEMLAVSWPLPDGTLLGPRLLSHAAAAPYLGESGLLYFLTVQPADGLPIVKGGHRAGLVYVALALYFGVAALLFWGSFRLATVRASSPTARRETPVSPRG